MSSKKTFATLEEALTYIAELEAAKKASDDSVASALSEVGSLSKKLDLMEKHKGENVNVVTVLKKEYKLLGNRFFINGVETDAAGLMKNKTELERLVKIKSGSLVELTESEN